MAGVKLAQSGRITYEIAAGWTLSAVAGARFLLFEGDLALLENAVTQFALDYVTKQGFIMTVPHMVNFWNN